MNKPKSISCATSVIVAIAEIKAAVEAFDRGDSNAYDAWDAIVIAVEARRAANDPQVRHVWPHSDVA